MTEEKIQQADSVHPAAPGSLSALRAASQETPCPEVKPCPFCGDEADVDAPPGRGSERLVYCKGCFASICEDSTPDAIAAWNRRAPTGQSRTSEAARSAPSYASPSDEPDTASVSQGMAQDAARYRWLLTRSWFQDEAEHHLHLTETETVKAFARVLAATIDASLLPLPQPTGERG